jgi:hypothetical protein
VQDPGVNARRASRDIGLRLLGIALILGLVRIPLPQLDYHNVRHHHSAGEVCPHHDHLLRWHPSASLNEDVAIVHWHWVLPNVQRSGADPEDANPGGRPSSGSAVHAHVDDGLPPDWGSELVSRPSALGRSPLPAASAVSTVMMAPHGAMLPAVSHSPPFGTPCADNVRTGLHAGMTVPCQRWNC